MTANNFFILLKILFGKGLFLLVANYSSIMSTQILDKNTWKKLRIDLNNSYEYNEKWDKVINLFKQRIDNFYFEPIQKILNPNLRKGEGFAIVTLQCALIEMLAAFKYGKIHNRSKKESDPSYEYRDSAKYFLKFLKTESLFENHFFTLHRNGVKQGNQPYKAEDFYNNVRCGLMHEARTKKDWLITAKKQTVTPNKIFIETNTENNKEIHRTNLHAALKEYFNNSYISELKKESKEGNKLRRFLARKLDHMHSIERDIKYDWWKDK